MTCRTQTAITCLIALLLSGGRISAQTEPLRMVEPLEVLKIGDGPVTMLIIPCMSCSANAWLDFMERNRQRYTMYAVTIPGYGGTRVPDLPVNTTGTPWRDHALEALSTLITKEKLTDVVLLGHSWGTMVAVQLAVKRPDAVVQLINVDGSLESTTWTGATPEERLRNASKTIEVWGPKLSDAEEWRKFNRVRVPDADTVPRARVAQMLRLHGSFMSTPREVILQYWRENSLIDLTSYLLRLRIRILDIKALRGPDSTAKRQKHLAELDQAGITDRIDTVFFYDTSHFVADHRPAALDRTVAAFIAREPIPDFIPNAD